LHLINLQKKLFIKKYKEYKNQVIGLFEKKIGKVSLEEKMTIKKELKVYSFSKKQAIITINTKHKNLTNQLAIYCKCSF